jgi:hypothetical protein
VVQPAHGPDVLTGAENAACAGVFSVNITIISKQVKKWRYLIKIKQSLISVIF